MFKISMKIGHSTLEYENGDVKKIHKMSAIYGALPEKCTECQSEDIFLSHKNPKENDYYGLLCKACGAEYNFHQKKADGGFYLTKDDKFTKYVPKDGALPPLPADMTNNAKGPANSEVPF